jgi:Ca-activated chloride channel family protein
VLAAGSLAWLDPHARAREGNRLYAAGKYDEAAAKYNEDLVDRPDSPLLHFNLGDAAYKQGKYADALGAFQQVPASDADPPRTARVAYNVGNTKYRLGEAAAGSDPKAALGLWAEALAAYRRALGAAPDDMDAKVNHEFVERKIAELRKKLEEEQKQQEQQHEQQQAEAGQPEPEEKRSQEDQPQEPHERQAEPEQQGGQPDQPQPQEAGGGERQQAAEERQDGEMSKQEAAAVLDSQRDQEVSPEEMAGRLLGTVEVEPEEDW